jgi:hypothetical protein
VAAHRQNADDITAQVGLIGHRHGRCRAWSAFPRERPPAGRAECQHRRSTIKHMIESLGFAMDIPRTGHAGVTVLE